jgi:hypothetical protein
MYYRSPVKGINDGGPSLRCSSSLTIQFGGTPAENSLGMLLYTPALMLASPRYNWSSADLILCSVAMLTRGLYNKGDWVLDILVNTVS